MGLQPGFRRGVFFLLLVVTLSFGWWPFSFVVRNDVGWHEEDRALDFNVSHRNGNEAARGMATSVRTLDTTGWKELSVVVVLKRGSRHSGLGVFLEFFESGAKLPPLLLAQWQNHLAIRSARSVEKVERGYSEIGYRDCFAKDDFVEILLSSKGHRTDVYVDGVRVEARRNFPLLDQGNRFVGTLVLGNSADGTQPFNGRIRRVAVYAEAIAPGRGSATSPVLQYDFARLTGDEVAAIGSDTSVVGLRIPEFFKPLDRNFVHSISFRNWDRAGFRRDAVINVIGFLPIGLCFAAAARRRFHSRKGVFLAVGAASFLLSLMIEMGQGYLVHRDSSQLDLLLNTCSGLLALLVSRRWILFL